MPQQNALLTSKVNHTVKDVTAATPVLPGQTISATFKERNQIDSVVGQLINAGIAHDRISVIGKNFHTETRITGFITNDSPQAEHIAWDAIHQQYDQDEQ
jgi:hypothetical protein